MKREILKKLFQIYLGIYALFVIFTTSLTLIKFLTKFDLPIMLLDILCAAIFIINGFSLGYLCLETSKDINKTKGKKIE